MKTKSLALSALFMLIALIFGQAQKPGFYVQGRFLYDRCGEKTILRGVNEMSVWAGADPTGAMYMPEIRKTGSNCVRIVYTTGGSLTTLDQLIQNCINNKMIPMIEMHDATGQWAKLPAIVAYWTRADVVALIKKHEQYLLVNIGNEIGDGSETDAMFTEGYSNAVKSMRAAGIHTPIVIDSNEYGNKLATLNNTAASILNSDMDKNLIFSVHTYWAKTYANSTFIASELQKAVNLGYKYGAWAGQGVSVCSPQGEIDYTAIMQECQKQSIGWLAWSWGTASNTGGGDAKCAIMDMAPGGKFSSLQAGYATEIAISSPYSIKNTSITPKSILNGSCGTTPPPTPTKQLTSCANSFLKSLTNLVANVGTQTCGVGNNVNTDVFGEMTDGCFAYGEPKTARVSYTMLKFTQLALPIQTRGIWVIWSGKKSAYDYYGACTPSPLVYQLPETTENHVFEAILVPVEAYKSSASPATRSFNDWKMSFAVPINTISKVQSVSIEPSTGYIATNDKAKYDNTHSSKGIVVRVLSRGRTIDCYLLNNYDTAGTLAWKQ
jgi:mannan endo-1,4-beta-mannosidase